MAAAPFKLPPLFRKPNNVEILKRLGVRAVDVVVNPQGPIRCLCSSKPCLYSLTIFHHCYLIIAFRYVKMLESLMVF